MPENDTTDILLQINDTIAITYTTLNETDLDQANYLNIVQHESMNRPRIKDKLTLSDCLEAFSRTEELDESNPWYCPMCRKNKCATKTLSVWRFPDYLIIYLKRYVVFNTNFPTMMHNYFCSLFYVKSSWVFPFSEKIAIKSGIIHFFFAENFLLKCNGGSRLRNFWPKFSGMTLVATLLY